MVLTLLVVIAGSTAVEAVYPVGRAVNFFKRRVFPWAAGFFLGAKAEAENVRLRREVASLSVMRLELERLDEENRRFRRLLDYSDRAGGGMTAAEVLYRGGGAAGVSETLRVARGSTDGVREGDIAVAPEGLVGLVDSVTLHTAEIAPLFSPSVRVACQIETGAAELPRAVAVGCGDALILKYLEPGAAIPPRSRVVTSGAGGVFPAGLEVGSFVRLVTNETGAVYGELLPMMNFAELEDVFIRHEK